MKPIPHIRFALVLALLVASVPAPSAAQTVRALPSPLRLVDVGRLASERRDEIEAARARLPLLWEGGVGADVSARTAAPVVGGLWSCMFLTLLVLPAAYAMWRRHQVRSALALSLTHHVTTASEGAA
jgi:copper/silver efflux system protein